MSKVELKRKETPMGGNNFDAARSAANDMFNRMDKVSTTEEQSAAQKPDVFTQANEGEQKKTANLQDMSIEQLRALGNAAKQSNDTKMMDLITAELERRIAAKASAPATTETAPTVKRTTTSFEVTRDSRTLKITSSTDDLKKALNNYEDQYTRLEQKSNPTTQDLTKMLSLEREITAFKKELADRGE